MNLIQLRHAQMDAPESLGTRDLLLGGGCILALEASLPALLARLAASGWRAGQPVPPDAA